MERTFFIIKPDALKAWTCRTNSFTYRTQGISNPRFKNGYSDRRANQSTL